MLKDLLALETADQIAVFGKELLNDSSFMSLESDLKEKHVAFSREDYLTTDTLNRYLQTANGIKHLLALDDNSAESVKILHRLQLVQKRCPVLSKNISSILNRMTF